MKPVLRTDGVKNNRLSVRLNHLSLAVSQGFGPDRGGHAQTGRLLLTLTAPQDPVGCSADFPRLTSGPQAFEHTDTLLSGALIPLEIMLCLPKNTRRYTWKAHHKQALTDLLD